MRTRTTTVTRRDHWRRRPCGPDRSEMRDVHVRKTEVALAPTNQGQFGPLEPIQHRPPPVATAAPDDVRREAPAAKAADERPVLFSYWRRQPCGPRGSLRRMTLVDDRRDPSSSSTRSAKPTTAP